MGSSYCLVDMAHDEIYCTYVHAYQELLQMRTSYCLVVDMADDENLLYIRTRTLAVVIVHTLCFAEFSYA